MSVLGVFAPITSSIRYNTARFNTIADAVNLQNVNGAKRSRLSFNTLLGERNPSASQNVVPPSGIRTHIRQDVSAQGTISNTGRVLDLSINGVGFIPVRPALEQDGIDSQDVLYMTRNGQLNLQQETADDGSQVQYLVDVDGHYVQGWQAPLGETFPEQTYDNLGPIQLTPDRLILNGQATGELNMDVNLPHDVNLLAGSQYPQIVTIYDAQGQSHLLNLEFTYSGNENNWDLTPTIIDEGGNVTEEFTSINYQFDTEGRLPADTPPIAFQYSGGDFTLNVNDVTSYGTDYSLRSVTQDGYPDGKLQFYDIDPTGTINGTFDNGKTAVIAQIAMVDVANRNTLTTINSSSGPKYQLNEGSMELQTYNLRLNPRSSMISGTVELSTIDLADVFTEMIETQHSYSISNNALQIINDMVQVAYRLKS